MVNKWENQYQTGLRNCNLKQPCDHNLTRMTENPDMSPHGWWAHQRNLAISHMDWDAGGHEHVGWQPSHFSFKFYTVLANIPVLTTQKYMTSKLMAQQNLHLDVYRMLPCLIFNCQQLKRTGKSFSPWMDTETVVGPHSTAMFLDKIEKISRQAPPKMWRVLKFMLLSAMINLWVNLNLGTKSRDFIIILDVF